MGTGFAGAEKNGILQSYLCPRCFSLLARGKAAGAKYFHHKRRRGYEFPVIDN
jgi:hypothetical protein